jgi:hypothetical protein
MESVTWTYGNTQLHTTMEVTAMLLALVVGIVAIVRYFARRHNMILFLGVGFIGTGDCGVGAGRIQSAAGGGRRRQAVPSIDF